MSARDAILGALGGVPTRPAAPPPVYAPLRDDADLFTRFAAGLVAAGGSVYALGSGAPVGEALHAHHVVQRARSIWSSLPEIAPRLPGAPPRTPHDLAELDLALLAGAFAVAESGAVWWMPREPLERAAGFLAEHVILIVPRAELVADLHAAYARIDVAAAPYGCFVCGPSKTADIEQALVIGAHGPKSLEVWLVAGAA